MTERRWYIAWAVWLAILAYIFVAMTVYAFRHPELTDTQRLLHIWDALTWR